MKFYKETTSYKLVTYLEQFKIRYRYFSIVLYMFYFIVFYITIKIKIKRKSSGKDKLNLFINIFKERFYLEQLKDSYELYNYNYSTLKYNIINNNIICNIYYDIVDFYIEYGLSNNTYCIFISTMGKNFNMTERQLANKNLYEMCNEAIKLISNETFFMLQRLFIIHIVEFLNSIFKRGENNG